MVMPETRPTPIEKPKLLLVEGQDDLHVFRALLSQIGDMPDIEVRQYGGKDNLGPFLRTLVAMSSFSRVRSVGVFRDADQDRDQAFRSVAGALQGANLPTPNRPLEAIGVRPQVIVEIIPPDGSKGEIEDVLLASVDGDPAFSCVDEFIQCLDARMGALPKKLSKARLHTFLASREVPDLLPGEAMWAGYFPWNSEAFVPIIRALRLL